MKSYAMPKNIFAILIWSFHHTINYIKNKLELEKYKLRVLYYMTPVENLENILRFGILSKNEIKRRNLSYESFALESVQERRDAKKIQLSDLKKRKSLHDCIPLYIAYKTPTLYYIFKNHPHEYGRIIFIRIRSKIVLHKAFCFTDGNAASQNSREYYDLGNLNRIDWNVVNGTYWNDEFDGKRKRCAEFLIYPNVERRFFDLIIVKSYDIKREVESILQKLEFRLNVEHNPAYYF